MKTKIISAFPGTGKSYATQKLNALDSDSSNFSWIEKDGVKIRNPDFPLNYIKHIKENIGTVDYIFVSSHKEVREALVDNNIEFTLIFPNKRCKTEYLKRYKKRGSSANFIDFIKNNWNNFLHELLIQKNCEKIALTKEQFILDIL